MPCTIKTNYSPSRQEDLRQIGILITNLGTPDAPTEMALQPYLKEFLSDTRVVEPPPAPWLWKLILNTMILRTRPAASAQAYQSIWNSEGDGSPLLDISQRQVEKVKATLTPHHGDRLHFALGMRYGRPSIATALQQLQAQGCQKILVFPLYPQYAGATTGSTFDAVFDELKKWRRVPALRTIDHYHDHEGYIQALANSIQAYQAEHGQPQKLIMSYHGIPLRYWQNGDPYIEQCHATSKQVAEKLGLTENDYIVTFQSRFGKEPWVEPYTDETLKALPQQGIKHVQVICPGFSADCLETIEEIGEGNRDYFLEAGGENFGYIPCLNDREDHIAALSTLIETHIQGW